MKLVFHKKYVLLALLISAPNYCFSESLTMNVSGKINDRCQVDFYTGNKIDLSSIKNKSIPMDIYCNRPMIMRFSSSNGGLVMKGREDMEPYLYFLKININDLNMSTMNKSDTLINPKEINSSGVIPFSTSGTIRVTLEEPLLFAGHYEDIVQIDVFPSIHNISSQ